MAADRLVDDNTPSMSPERLVLQKRFPIEVSEEVVLMLVAVEGVRPKDLKRVVACGPRALLASGSAGSWDWLRGGVHASWKWGWLCGVLGSRRLALRSAAPKEAAQTQSFWEKGARFSKEFCMFFH